MQILPVADAETGWSFDAKVDDSGTKPLPGGLILAFLEHQGHNFAREVRVAGIWLEVQTVEPAGRISGTTRTYVELDGTSFTAGPVEQLRPAPVGTGAPAPGQSTFAYLRFSDECLDFGTYFAPGANPVGYGIRASFDSTPAMFATWPNCEVSHLRLTQTFLFSRYASFPPHEPGGVLTAARFHPVTRYEWTANPKVDRSKPYSRVASLRVDYRINYFIDGRLRPYGSARQLVQAGLFADHDAPPIIGMGLLAPVSKAATSRAVFRAAEKPVLLEVVAPGLVRGTAVFRAPDGSDVPCWDNIHWWGERGVGKPLISAPGAFHAVHLHWRWGAATAFAPHGSLPTFKPGPLPPPSPSVPTARQLGGYTPLVDPGAWIQSLEFAIVDHQPWASGAPHNAARLSWDVRGTFTALRPAPRDISGGGDLVLWMAVTVHRETIVFATLDQPGGGFHAGGPKTVTVPVKYVTKPVGRLFVHGMFFGHEAEISKFGVGTTDPQHFPASEKAVRSGNQWLRTPQR